MSEENYFRFPLAILQGLNYYEPHQDYGELPSYSDIMEDAISYAVINAGIGYKRNKGQEDFEEELEVAIEEIRSDSTHCYEGVSDYTKYALVGASICKVSLKSSFDYDNASWFYQEYSQHVFPLVTMKAEIFWAAFHQARYEDNKGDLPARGISWREFRILCAILSVKKNREGFSFVGWQEIQARSCGMLRKPYKATKRIPEHLTTPYSQKQIKRTCDRLEALNFFTRCRHSKGNRGGFMAYSFKHSPEDLRKAVGRWASFRRGDSIRQNRAADLAYALKNQ